MSYKTLKVYQKAHTFGIECHRLSLMMPKYELYETGSQLRRASKSVSANIVEGYGRKRYPADYLKFLVYALASNDESREWLEYVQSGYHELQNDVRVLLPLNDEVGRMLNRLIQSLEP
ncbi:MAG: four helix bundle protein [Opitutaceae bacterium]